MAENDTPAGRLWGRRSRRHFMRTARDSLSSLPVISFHPSLTASPPAGWPRALAIARAARYEAIDIVISDVAELDPYRVRDELDRAGIAAGPAALPIEFRSDEATFQTGIASLPRLAQLASLLGVRTMYRSIPASSDTRPLDLRRILRRRITAIGEVLGANEIDFAVEVIGPLHRRREGRYEFVWRMDDAADLITDCPANVGLLADSWHWHHGDETVADLLAVGPQIRHVHVADSPDLPAESIRDSERLLPGEGAVDLFSFSRALTEIRYAGFISPEITGYACSAGGVVCAARAREATATHVVAQMERISKSKTSSATEPA